MTSARSVLRENQPVVAIDEQRRYAAVADLADDPPDLGGRSAARALRSLRRGSARRGFVISARPIASICCSPPDSCWPPWSSRSARRGNVVEHALEVPVAPAVRRALRGELQVLAHREVREDAAAFGHVARCPCARSGTGASRGAVAVRARAPCRPSPASAPSSVRISVVLPMPLRPSRPDRLAARRSPAIDAAQHMARAVMCMQAVRLDAARSSRTPASRRRRRAR